MKSLMLCLASLWLGMSILADFFIAPTLFRQVPEFFVAGKTALAIFSQLNLLELLLSASLFLCSSWVHLVKRNVRWPLLLSLGLAAIALLYNFSLTPKMSELTTTWEYAERVGRLGLGGEDIQQLHQTYHRTYVTIDTIKILCLTAYLVLIGRQR